MLKGLAQSRNKGEKKKRSTKPTLNNQKMAIGTYISIITLNVNKLMLQPKDIDWLNGCKNKTPIYAVYKRPTTNVETHTD